MNTSLLAFLVLGLVATTTLAASKDLGDGFLDHGVCVPISNHRGTVATVDGNGHNVLLSLLSDHRGGYELLLLDTQTQTAEQFPLPFTKPIEDYPYASLLSKENKFYTHFANFFVEFDPVARKFTFSHESAPQMAMGMTEDQDGVIWSATYPNSGLVSFNPKTREFKDYGYIHNENWPQYDRAVAVDDTGVVYIGLGETACQILAFDPKTRKSTPLLAESDRMKGQALVYRDRNGKCYGRALADQTKENWYEFYKGEGKKIGKHEKIDAIPCITGSQALAHFDFPDGSKVKDYDLVERKLTFEDAASKTTKSFPFTYDSEGAVVMGCAVSPDSMIRGGTAFPMREFYYNPKTDELVNRYAWMQWNTVRSQGDHFFAGGYPGGFLLDLDPSKPWVQTKKDEANANPLMVVPDCDPIIHRPHALLAHPDGHTIVMGGTPQYGYTGGGLLFWDRVTKTKTLLTDEQLIPNQSTMSLVALSNDQLLAGTTTTPGTGGEKKAKQAELYLLDFNTKKVLWHEAIIPDAQGYMDLRPGPNGQIYGVADSTKFFVFDPATKKITHEQNLDPTPGPTSSQQGNRIFVVGPNDTIYVLLKAGIGKIDATTNTISLIQKSPVPIEAGGDYLDGRIYFHNGSHLYSWKLP